MHFFVSYFLLVIVSFKDDVLVGKIFMIYLILVISGIQ